MSEHMRGHRTVDTGFVGNACEDALDGAGRHADRVIDSKMAVNQWTYPVGEGNDAALGLCAVDTAFAVDHQPVVLPVDILARESGQLGHSQASVQQCPDNE